MGFDFGFCLFCAERTLSSGCAAWVKGSGCDVGFDFDFCIVCAAWVKGSGCDDGVKDLISDCAACVRGSVREVLRFGLGVGLGSAWGRAAFWGSFDSDCAAWVRDWDFARVRGSEVFRFGLGVGSGSGLGLGSGLGRAACRVGWDSNCAARVRGSEVFRFGVGSGLGLDLGRAAFRAGLRNWDFARVELHSGAHSDLRMYLRLTYLMPVCCYFKSNYFFRVFIF